MSHTVDLPMPSKAGTYAMPYFLRGRVVLVTTNDRGWMTDWQAVDDPALKRDIRTLPRGVYPLLLGREGHPVFVAVDSQGEYVRHLTIEHPGDRAKVEASLWDSLAKADPPRRQRAAS